MNFTLNDTQQKVLEEVAEAVVNGEISLGIGVDWLESETGRSISRPGLKKYVDKNFRS